MKVLLTGPSGRVGPHLLPSFRERYDLRTYDLKPSSEPNSFVGDLSQIEPLRAAMQGVDVVVHLAATSDEAPFVEALVPNNVIGVYNLLEAARLEKVRRVVFASTVQTIGRYPKNSTVETDQLPRPNSLYGATKVFGETLGRVYHDNHGLEFIAVRIGYFQPYDSANLRAGRHEVIWTSPNDLNQLLHKAIKTPDVGYAIVHCTSRTPHEFMSLASAREILGFEPQDNSADYVQK